MTNTQSASPSSADARRPAGARASDASSAEVRVVPGRIERMRAERRASGEASFFYREVAFNADAVKVMPGEYFVHSEDLVITTTLGSCIAACLWDRQAAVGGINHFMLPGDGASDDGGRYGSCAMELLINALIKRGATRRTLEAKVFGGAALIAGNGALNVGQRNTSFVLDYLRTEEIPLVSQDVLGPYPRKVCFFPKTGRAMVRRLPPAQREAAIALDQDARRRASASAAGSIDLF